MWLLHQHWKKSSTVCTRLKSNDHTGNICTFYLLYKQLKYLLLILYRRALLNSLVYGVTYGFSQGIIYSTLVVTFAFGGFQVIQDETSVTHADFVGVFIGFSAVISGALAAGESGAFGANYSKAKLAAKRILSILQLKPDIDSFSASGVKPVSNNSKHFFKQLYTSPSRSLQYLVRTNERWMMCTMCFIPTAKFEHSSYFLKYSICNKFIYCKWIFEL